MKKLLVLGAMEMHVPLIKRAKEMGVYVITVDYIPENPGHKLADEAYFDSTTDFEAVLELASKLKIDGIMTYNSDPAAPTAAYVAEQLGLPGNPYKTVQIMSNKNLFRDFLKNNNLNCPVYFDFSSWQEVLSSGMDFPYPVIVKPVDSSGSKGCAVVTGPTHLEPAVGDALAKSRCKKAIIEEYIEPLGRQLHGDGFVEKGKVTFLYLGDHHFDSDINDLVPYSTTYPTEQPQDAVQSCLEQIQGFMTKVGFKNGGFNVELRISKKNQQPYIIDIGARNGGNFTPRVIEYGSGFNFLDRAIKVALGENVETVEMTDKISDFVSYLILHSNRSGVLNNCTLSPELEHRIIEKHIYAKPGDKVEPFLGANTALGVLLMKYESREDMNRIVSDFENLYQVDVRC